MRLERAEWGSDLPSVEAQLEAQRHIHASVEDLGSSVKEARVYEVRCCVRGDAGPHSVLGKGRASGVTFVGEGGWGGYFLRTELLNDAGPV